MRGKQWFGPEIDPLSTGNGTHHVKIQMGWSRVLLCQHPWEWGDSTFGVGAIMHDEPQASCKIRGRWWWVPVGCKARSLSMAMN